MQHLVKEISQMKALVYLFVQMNLISNETVHNGKLHLGLAATNFQKIANILLCWKNFNLNFLLQNTAILYYYQ